jgi:glucose-1-phosphate cytidylyltransferase
MEAVILAGGFGTRISEESHLRPKPMIEIGGKPILWHIMKMYSHHGINDFIICLGYKGYVLKEYFSNYFLHMSDVTFRMQSNEIEIHQRKAEPWNVTLIDTGEKSMTGGRLKRVASYLGDETFCFTYGDGVSDIDVTSLVAYHRNAGRKATVTAIQPPGRYGSLLIENDAVQQFQEKPAGDGVWINGGFFVLEPSVVEYIEDDLTVWEQEPLQALAREYQLSALLEKAIAEKRLSFDMSPGDQLRDYLSIEEVAERFARAIVRPDISGVINCCSGRPIAVIDLVERHLQIRSSSIRLNRGGYGYPDYEALAFWGIPEKLRGLGFE